MTKTFSVNIGGQQMQFDGPDNGTQEDAQKYAEAAFAKKQQADVQRDFSGASGGSPGSWGETIGKKVANFAQGGAELVGGPAQLAGATPGGNYQTAENAPRDFGDNVARFAGAALPLGPLGAMGVGGKVSSFTGDPSVARFLASKGLPFAGKAVNRAAIPGITKVAPAVGAVEGASAPAKDRTSRAINTGLGALTGGMSNWTPTTLSALDRLAGAAGGYMMGGGHGWSEVLGARLGESVGGHIHPVTAIRNWLSQIPASARARFISQIAAPFTGEIGEAYDEFTGNITNADQSQSPSQR